MFKSITHNAHVLQRYSTITQTLYNARDNAATDTEHVILDELYDHYDALQLQETRPHLDPNDLGDFAGEEQWERIFTLADLMGAVS